MSNTTIIAITDRQRNNIARAVLQTADSVLKDAPYVALAVDLVQEFGQWRLQVFVENHKNRIELDACAVVCERLLDALDNLAELQALDYQLEVSSPGLFRPLQSEREFAFYSQRQAAIQIVPIKDAEGQFVDPIDAQPVIKGHLFAYNATNATLSLLADGQQRQVALMDYPEHQVTLAPEVEWPES